MVREREGASAASMSVRLFFFCPPAPCTFTEEIMTNEQLIYTKVEFTLDMCEHDSVRFREAVRKLLRDFEGYLIGFQAEDLISGNILCDDAGFAEADFVLKSVFPDHVANHLNSEEKNRPQK